MNQHENTFTLGLADIDGNGMLVPSNSLEGFKVIGESNVEKLREKAKRQVDGGLKRSAKRQRA